jgi:hypothetical protein
MARFLLAFTMLAFALCGAKAHDHDAYSAQYNEWAAKQLVTPEAGKRMACGEFSAQNASCYCCHKSEVVKTKFRVAEDNDDAWDWQVPGTNIWRRVPADVIHWGEETPSKEVLFLLNGVERCFFPPQDGGG